MYNFELKLIQYLLDGGYPIGSTENITTVFHERQNDSYLATTENFYIHIETKISNC